VQEGRRSGAGEEDGGKGHELRKRAIKTILPISATFKVVTIGAVFAGVVLWDV
jgi:hypothetical protein